MKITLQDLEEYSQRISRKASTPVLAACGLIALLALNGLRLYLRRQAADAGAQLAAFQQTLEEARQALDENQSSQQTRAKELERFKSEVTKLTQTRRTAYELGLETQEEKRLLEKQLEIMTTYLLVDIEAKKIHLMRGDQSLETYPIAYAPPKAFGDAKNLPELTQIVSKERFAHPERGKSEEVNGKLEWQPPQVGTSARANALGEYVMFTHSGLILHGPPHKAAEHLAYGHYCLGLSLAVAKKLYQESYIGTRIMIKRTSEFVGR